MDWPEIRDFHFVILRHNNSKMTEEQKEFRQRNLMRFQGGPTIMSWAANIFSGSYPFPFLHLVYAQPQ